MPEYITFKNEILTMLFVSAYVCCEVSSLHFTFPSSDYVQVRLEDVKSDDCTSSRQRRFAVCKEGEVEDMELRPNGL